MAARRREPATMAKQKTPSTTNSSKNQPKSTINDDYSHYYPPLFLVFVVLLCSGPLALLAMRDFAQTGRIIFGEIDANFLTFTKSMDWFNDSKGWKSTQGGFSAVQQFTTDENNMGGFFVRKLAGAAALGVQIQKLLPLLMHPTGADWSKGHFKPLLTTAIVGNVFTILFYAFYMNDLIHAGAELICYVAMGLLTLESIVFLYSVMQKKSSKTIAIAMPEGKTPTSTPSRIVARTILIISSFMALIAARDLFFPGTIIPAIPRDDIYLEWTNAFLHSPPEGSPEASVHGLEAPLFIGDKFISQWMGLNMLILCLYKLVTALMVPFGSDGSGLTKCRMIWGAQSFANAAILFIFRLFTPAAKSASIHFQWHLMALAYETFILFLYAYF